MVKQGLLKNANKRNKHFRETLANSNFIVFQGITARIHLFNTSRKYQHAAQQVLAVSSFAEIENPVGEGAEQPAPGEPALHRDWAGQSPDPAPASLGLSGCSFLGM